MDRICSRCESRIGTFEEIFCGPCMRDETKTGEPRMLKFTDDTKFLARVARRALAPVVRLHKEQFPKCECSICECHAMLVAVGGDYEGG